MSLSPSPRRAPGLVAGRYLIQRKLGAGAMGTVYLATDTVDPRRPKGGRVALKVIRADRLLPGAVKRLQEEFRALSLLRHPRIAAAYDFGYLEEGRIPYYTREYIEGAPLLSGPPRGETPRDFLRPILEVLDALEYLHERGILHLDIHPGNVILCEERRRGAVLIDFGLVRAAGGSYGFSGGVEWSGLPPELAEDGEATIRSDLFLAGRLLLYRLTGRASGTAALPKEISGWGARLTLELERILSKALESAAEERFSSAAEFRRALSIALGDRPPRPGGAKRELAVGSIVGRERELARIDRTIRTAGRGETALLWLTGKKGAGKTRLLREAKVRAQLAGLQAVEASFSSSRADLARALGAGGTARSSAWLEPLATRHGGTPEERAERAAEAYFTVADTPSGETPPLVLLLDDLDAAAGDNRRLAESMLAECIRRRGRSEGTGRGARVHCDEHGAAAPASAARRRLPTDASRKRCRRATPPLLPEAGGGFRRVPPAGRRSRGGTTAPSPSHRDGAPGRLARQPLDSRECRAAAASARRPRRDRPPSRDASSPGKPSPGGARCDPPSGRPR